jgi:hypothetical protein
MSCNLNRELQSLGPPGPSLLSDIRGVQQGHILVRPRTGYMILLWHGWLLRPEAVGVGEWKFLR